MQHRLQRREHATGVRAVTRAARSLEAQPVMFEEVATRHSVRNACVSQVRQEGEVVATGFGLYYPHVHFRDPRWLKTAALHWDRLDSFFADDVDQTIRSITYEEIELMDAGFIRQLTPSIDQLERAADEFQLILVGPGIDNRAFDSAESKLSDSIATWKVSPGLVEQLTEAGLGKREHGSRLRMHPTLAHAYLLVLGRQIAGARGACLVADDAVQMSASAVAAKRLVRGLLEEPIPAFTADERQILLVNLAIKTVIPRDIDQIPIREIIKFREEFAGQRAAFRDATEMVLKEITDIDITDPDALLEHIQSRYDTKLRPSLVELKRAMRRYGWTNTALGTVSIQASTPPVAASALALLAFHPSVPATTAIGLGGFGLGVWRSALENHHKRREAIYAEPVAYLYHLHEDLSPVGLIERVRTTAARFTPPLRG